MFNKTWGIHLSPFTIRLVGGLIGCAGFILAVYKPASVSFSVALIGLGSFIISLGGGK